ncbi:MAG: UvrD-helicase domain-containing protein [Prolixibacteraceae bacterium]|nr:UvrD-helicase domain-containing protein [Prolixibacteraceae bacterium]
MSKLTIYKASAGSGKTYRLVLEYLKLLIENPVNYRHTLAVTFTNKATAEMKERILRNLYEVASGKDDKLMGTLISETGKPESHIVHNAGLSLSLLLHDYDHFSVNTIDSFFQGVLRSFARELGLYGAYEVDLDSDAVLNEACDRLLMEVENDNELCNWLLSMAEERLNSGKSWQIRDEIINLGKEFLKEASLPFQLNMPTREQERENIKELKKRLLPKIKWFENECRKLGERGVKLLSDYGLTLDDFSYKKSSFAGKFEKLAEFPVDKFELGKRFYEALDQPEKWATAKNRNPGIDQCYSGGMNELVRETINFFEKNKVAYYTAIEVYKHIYTLGVLSVLLANIREIGQENNSLLLNEGNLLLRGIIGDNDAPFIYEKTGNYFQHFMFDEFQDTSVLQWENFKPLVLNSLSENHSNLVVGDVKQSIYRWRNGDWTLLSERLPDELGKFGVSEVSLDSNWRSAKNIVEFNNSLFEHTPGMLQEEFNALVNQSAASEKLIPEFGKTIENAFSDVTQKPVNNDESGLVSISFVAEKGDDNYRADTISQLINSIKEVQDKGYRAGEIAILVRKNNIGTEIANKLLDYGKGAGAHGYNFSVMSNDSLMLESSQLVKFIILLFDYVINPWDNILQATLVYNFENYILPVLLHQGTTLPKITFGDQQQIQFLEDDDSGSGLFSGNVERDYFPFFKDENGAFFRQKWAAMSVVDLVSEFISLYRLSELPGEQASIEAFKDAVIDFTRTENSNLYRFSEWWKENGSKLKLQTSGNRDAIRIITVHKAKGLEFPVVMVPFCDWEIIQTGKSGNFIWGKAGAGYDDIFPVVPIGFSRSLGNTVFHREYFIEVLMSAVDNLNVLYVALTRAIEGMYLFTSRRNEKKKEIKNVSDLLCRLMFAENPLLSQKSETVFSIGELSGKQRSEKAGAEFNLTKAVTVQKDISSILRLHKNFEEFLEPSTQEWALKINRGKLIHEVLSMVETEVDLETSILKMQIAGKIDKDDAIELQQELNSLLALPEVCTWFNGTYRILNETTVIAPGFKMYRPDRIMISGNEAVIVDYKTGDVVENAHCKQVKRYAGLLESMGYQKVEGFVWYLKLGELIKLN